MMRPDPIHRPGDGTSLRAVGVLTRPKFDLSLLLGGGGTRRFVGIEGHPVDPHPMQDNRKLASERHLGLAHAGALGHGHGPSFEHRPRTGRVRMTLAAS